MLVTSIVTISQIDKVYDQAVASFIQPVKDNWRIMGHAQYDLDNSLMREYLLGVNYESCCWAVSVYGRSTITIWTTKCNQMFIENVLSWLNLHPKV